MDCERTCLPLSDEEEVARSLRARITELEAELTSYRNRLDLAERYHDEAEGKLTVAEQALQRVMAGAPLTFLGCQVVAKEALAATGVREVEAMRSMQATLQRVHALLVREGWVDYASEVASTLAAVRGEVCVD